MTFLRKLFSFFYMAVMVLAGLSLAFMVWGILPPETFLSFCDFLGTDIALQVAASLVALIFILTGISAPAKVSRRLKKRRVVSFQNPDGEVTISLSAIEDYVRKVARGIGDIEEVRSKVGMSKKGINIISDVVIASGANIPEVTEAIQLQVKQRLQNMLGVEERINVKMHVRKIGKAGDGDDSDEESRRVPYREMD